FKKQILISYLSNFYVKEKNICPYVTLTTQKKEDRKISDTLIKPFSSIIKDNLQSVEYIQSNNDDIQEIITTVFEILLTSRNTMPF
ncbi:pathogenicity determinant protein PdpA1, partial [Francisella tularensis subsp. holarctica]|nr:pathogenicity determinant protein PdpA1 [Francisella tularensis subsp. holarctica]